MHISSGSAGGSVGNEKVDFMPTRAVRSDQRPLWMVGCHGGAGTTTLAQTIPGAADAARYWPLAAPGAAATKVVLVARSNVVGLTAAQHAARQWDESLRDRVGLLGLAVIADAPGKRLPRELADLLQLLSGGVPALWVLPWVESLRVSPQLDTTAAPPSYRTFLSDLADLGWVDDLRTVAREDGRPRDR